jgi:hypothetical protein
MKSGHASLPAVQADGLRGAFESVGIGAVAAAGVAAGALLQKKGRGEDKLPPIEVIVFTLKQGLLRRVIGG